MTSGPQVSCFECDASLEVTMDDLLAQRVLHCPRGHPRRLDDLSATAFEIVAEHDDEVRRRG